MIIIAGIAWHNEIGRQFSNEARAQVELVLEGRDQAFMSVASLVGRMQDIKILVDFLGFFFILHFSFLISSAKVLPLFLWDSLTHNFKPLTRDLNTRRAWKHSLIPHREQRGWAFFPWNFAFHVRSARLQPGGSDEETFTPHSCADVHVWMHVYLHTHAFMRPVKSASGVYTQLHLADSRRRWSGCLEKILHKYQTFHYILHIITGWTQVRVLLWGPQTLV